MTITLATFVTAVRYVEARPMIRTRNLKILILKMPKLGSACPLSTEDSVSRPRSIPSRLIPNDPSPQDKPRIHSRSPPVLSPQDAMRNCTLRTRIGKTNARSWKKQPSDGKGKRFSLISGRSRHREMGNEEIPTMAGRTGIHLDHGLQCAHQIL